MKTSCEVPLTLLGFLLQSRSKNCIATEEVHFFKEYAIREINVLLWISLISITVLLLMEVIKLVSLWTKGSRIPGPPCTSFFCHSRLLSSENLTDFLSKAHEKYGSIVRLWLGPTQLLVSVKDPTAIKEILVKAEDKLPFTGKAFRLAFGHSSLFVSSFEKMNRLAAGIGARGSCFRGLRQSLESKAADLADIESDVVLNLLKTVLKWLFFAYKRAYAIHLKVVDHVIEKPDSIMTEGVLDCKLVSQHLAFSILGSTLFGDAFFAWSSATDYEELLMKIANDGCCWASYSVPPFWRRGFWRYKCLCTRLKCLTQDIIEQCRQSYKFGQLDQNLQNGNTKIGGETATDVILSSGDVMKGDLFLAELDGFLNKKEPCGNIMAVMFHGCLTTAALIGNILARLVMHPEIQDKIYSEIIMVRNRSTESDSQSIYEMNYLLATVYESTRLLPAGPLLQRCSRKHDLNLETGITVPAGAIVVVPIQLVQMDGSNWGSDASEFNPQRFMSKARGSDSKLIVPLTGDTKKAVDPSDNQLLLNDPNANDAFLPFGSGKRACVGQKFAILAVAALLASVLQQYEIKLHPDPEDDPKPTVENCVLQLLPSPKIIFVKRNC